MKGLLLLTLFIPVLLSADELSFKEPVYSFSGAATIRFACSTGGGANGASFSMSLTPDRSTVTSVRGTQIVNGIAHTLTITGYNLGTYADGPTTQYLGGSVYYFDPNGVYRTAYFSQIGPLFGC